MRDLEHFEVLTRAKRLTVSCYRLTRVFPDTERFGLTSQINRASVSIAANIAEGLGRGTQGEFERYLRIALGSAAELKVLLDLSSEVLDLAADQMAGITEEPDAIRRKLNRLTSKVAAER
jgi:four helix bundle protein